MRFITVHSFARWVALGTLDKYVNKTITVFGVAEIDMFTTGKYFAFSFQSREITNCQ